MDKNTPKSHIVSIDDINSSATSSSRQLHNPPEEVFPLRHFARRSVQLPTERDDPNFVTASATPSLQNTIAGRDIPLFDNIHVESISEKRPQWLEKLAARSRTKLDSFLRTPGISHITRWMRGPYPPRRQIIKPIFPKLQSWPTSVISRYLSTNLGCTIVAVLMCIIWVTAFSVLLTNSTKTAINRSGDDVPVRLSCIARLWDDAPGCGVNGRACQPFQGNSFRFICPSGCASVKVLYPQVVGNQTINYRNWVIGGLPANNQGLSIYRGDSFICPAAVHAGVISNSHGGCGILNREGQQNNFPSVDRNGILSIGYEPSFPMGISFTPTSENCNDPQWNALIISVLATVVIAMIDTPPALFFSSIFVIVFFQVALVSDAPYSLAYADVLSTAFGRFLPAAFVGAIMYRYCVRYTMTDLRAYWERAILWVGGCWVGALNAYTFDKIPLSRLTAHDIRQQPGAIVALIVIVVVLLAAAVGQVWMFRLEGRLLRYIRVYILLGVLLGCLSCVPGLDLRLHHYIVGLLLLPGTTLQTRPSLLYQGILVGLLINGIARWGFSSVLQTSAVLTNGAQQGSDLPIIATPNITSNVIRFTIDQIADGFDGISVVVNDVERFQATNVSSLPVVFNWTRTAIDDVSFFRFAFTGTYLLGGVWYGDYTKPGTWFANGTWKDILPGTIG